MASTSHVVGSLAALALAPPPPPPRDTASPPADAPAAAATAPASCAGDAVLHSVRMYSAAAATVALASTAACAVRVLTVDRVRERRPLKYAYVCYGWCEVVGFCA